MLQIGRKCSKCIYLIRISERKMYNELLISLYRYECENKIIRTNDAYHFFYQCLRIHFGGCFNLLLYICKRCTSNFRDHTQSFSWRDSLETIRRIFWYITDDCGKYLRNCGWRDCRCSNWDSLCYFYGKILS